MRFVVDMNLSPAWVDDLTARGHDAVHWREVGALDAPDESIAAWAARHGRTVLTADLDFGALIATRGATGPGVVQLRTRATNPARVGALVARALDRAGADLLPGSVLTIEPGQVRLRPPPSSVMDEP